MRTVGIFRVTASDTKVKELELHMSQGNYSFLRTVSPHVAANYLKRVFREMREPLITEELNDYILRISEEQEVQRESESVQNEELIELLRIKFLLN